MDTIRLLLPAFGLPLLVACLFSLFAASRPTSRKGWLGVPFAVLVVFIMWSTSIDENLALAAGGGIAGLSAGRLPRLDRAVAVASGLVATWLFMWVVPQGGADSPVNWIVAICSAGFAAGGLAAILFCEAPAALRRREAVTSPPTADRPER